MLELSGVNVHYGKIHVLHDVGFSVGQGEVAALIGPNAAGKTTMLRTLVGLKDCTSGVIRFEAHPIQELSTPDRVRLGIVLVPEGLGRGLMAKPRLLLLDEPTLGLAPIIVEEIELAIGRLAGRGMTILIAEQNAAMAMRVAHRVYVLKSGRISLEGSPAELARSPEIQRLYLGT